MKSIIGTKIGMTTLFTDKGVAMPCTIVYCDPNVVLSSKADGFVTIGYGETKENKKNKAHKGVFKKNNLEVKQKIFTLKGVEQQYGIGDTIKVDLFTQGEIVDVQGTTKGHGFTGAIKRWNFKIGPLSHGAGYPHRYQGSIAFGRGGNAPQRVYKGKKMHGHWGHETVTMENLVVLKVMADKNLILIKGAIPGPEGSIVKIKTASKKPGVDKDIAKVNFYELEKKSGSNAKSGKELEQENEKLEDKVATEFANAQEEAKEVAEEIAKEEAKERKAAEQHHEKLLEKEEELNK